MNQQEFSAVTPEFERLAKLCESHDMIDPELYTKYQVKRGFNHSHHYEYWTDMNRGTKCYEPVPMPRRYFVEMVMDRRAACMTYQGKAYRDDSALQYFERSREKDLMHPETSRQLRFILGMLAEKGEAETFSYLRRSVLKGKPFPWEEAQDSLTRK